MPATAALTRTRPPARSPAPPAWLAAVVAAAPLDAPPTAPATVAAVAAAAAAACCAAALARRGRRRRFLLSLLDGRLRDLLGQLPLHLVQGRLGRGRFLLVGLRERLGLRGLGLRLRRLRLLRGLLGLQLRLGLQQRGLVLGQIADDLVRVLVARLVLRRRGGEVGGEPGLGCAVDVGLRPRQCATSRLSASTAARSWVEVRGDGLQRRLRVLEVLLRRVVLVVEDGGLLLLLGQRGLDLADLRLGGVDLRLVGRRSGQRGGRRRARVRHGRRRQQRAEEAGDHGHPDEEEPACGQCPDNSLHPRRISVMAAMVAISASLRVRPGRPELHAVHLPFVSRYRFDRPFD